MVYDTPFGIASVSLQVLMWPNAPEILTKAAFRDNFPFILNTATTMSIERACEVTEGKAWFQLYNPVKDTLRDAWCCCCYPMCLLLAPAIVILEMDLFYLIK